MAPRRVFRSNSVPGGSRFRTSPECYERLDVHGRGRSRVLSTGGRSVTSPLVNIVEQFDVPALTDQLALVDEALRQAVRSEERFLTDVSRHLIDAGGKRLRPALVLATTVAGGQEVTEQVISGAAAVELMHLGSLYHDDVIDEAQQRRGVDSANARWGNLVAILAGDFLLARASELAAALGTEVAGLMAATISCLCQGEVSQLQYAFNPDRPESAYFAAIEGKTASLLSTSARVGGLVTGLDRTRTDALTQFGRCFGVAFQIWDDVRDLVASEDDLGKPAGHDLVEGTYTLPVIRALASPAVGGELRSLLGTALDPPTREKARDLILASDAVVASVVEARRWADAAVACLLPVRQGGSGEMLDQLGGLAYQLIDSLPVRVP